MTETIIKRAIGAALFACVLVVIVPWLFDGSGEVLTSDPPSIVEIRGLQQEQLKEVANGARQDREALQESQRQAGIRRDASGRVVQESPIAVPLDQPLVSPPDPSGQLTEGADPDTPQEHGDDAAHASPAAPISELVPPSQHAETAPDTAPSPQSGEKQQPSPATSAEQNTATGARVESRQKDQLGDFIAARQSDWVVQTGLFSQPDNARKMHLRLAEEIKDKAFIGTIGVNGKQYQGVFAGPYADKKSAELARDRLNELLKIRSYVRPFIDIDRQIE